MIKILYENPSCIVCVKPIGISSQDDGMGKLLSEQLNSPVFCVHRLDKAVSGVMVYARSAKAAASLSNSITDKGYLAVVESADLPAEGTMEDFLYHDQRSNKSFVVKSERRGSRKAKLTYELLQKNDNLNLIGVKLYTGRTHQIRVQFASRKMPLLGDGRYGSRIKCPIALFSSRLTFIDPETQKEMTFTALPESTYPFDQFDLSIIKHQ